MVKTKLGINLNKPGNNINLNKPTNNINLNKPNNINLNKPTQSLRDKDNEPGNFWLPRFSEPPGGLVPINNTGFYRTPDEPADPRDCERYPDSPYCGGNPFSFNFISLDPSIAVDECNIGIRLDGTLGFIRMPPVGLVYRRPECRVQPVNRERNLPDDTTDRLPLLTCPTNRRSQVVAIICPVFASRYHGYTISPYFFPNPGWGEVTKTQTLEILDFTYPYIGEDQHCWLGPHNHDVAYPQEPRKRYEWIYSEQLYKPIIYLKVKRATLIESNDRYKQYHDPEGPNFVHRNSPFPEHIRVEFKDEQTYDIYLSIQSFRPRVTNPFDDKIIATFNPFPLWDIGDFPLLRPDITVVIGECSDVSSVVQQFYNSRQTQGNQTEFVTYEYQYEVITKYLDIQLPPPTMPNECCPDDLIRLLIQKVDRLSEVVGIDEYPATVPDSFINRRGGFLGQVQSPNNIQIASLTKLFEWYVKRFDELMGEWEIPIEIKDSDPTTPGDQNLGFALPNLAEAIAEMMLLLLQVNINSETLVNMNTRTMIEVGQDKQQNFKSYMMTSAIADYLGFKYEEKSHKLPMLFDIGKEDYDQLLKETEVNVVAPEFDGKQNLQEALHRLLEGAAITKAANFRKLNNNDNMKQQIVDLLKGYSKTKKTVNNTEDDFDQFIENAEVGFTNESGITDTTRPYGRDYSERPRIREIGNTSETES